ncbi:arylesterase [Notoacmeibacter sp. MSK16QG-6]|uniref:arylesterase n=1 Tax=Notoacmeibacter sp. MSK16QG-6 TaxID=2957982 RepID=UPI0020A15292|nr:arylesterase [Notoacmeibacter sp. MSK16QG-6]MCP1199163.1 arylesterase [Notoacmeibacter sp. MSK16QG-6]
MSFKPQHLSNWPRMSAFLAFFILVATLIMADPALAKPLKVVAFGDSLMAGYQLGPREGFAPRMQAALEKEGYEAEVVNAAVSGDTTSGGKARLDWSVPDDADLVLLELGANDMLRGQPPETARANLDAMLSRLSERGVATVLFGMKAAPQLGSDYVKAFDSIYPALAEKHDVPLVPFFLDGVAANRAMLLDDGMHPNPKGVESMVRNALPTVIEALRDRGAIEG